MTLIKALFLVAITMTFAQGALASTESSEVNCGDEVVRTCEGLKAMWMD